MELSFITVEVNAHPAAPRSNNGQHPNCHLQWEIADHFAQAQMHGYFFGVVHVLGLVTAGFQSVKVCSRGADWQITVQDTRLQGLLASVVHDDGAVGVGGMMQEVAEDGELALVPARVQQSDWWESCTCISSTPHYQQ
jgi:hypothetical protein